MKTASTFLLHVFLLTTPIMQLQAGCFSYSLSHASSHCVKVESGDHVPRKSGVATSQPPPKY